MKPELVEIVDTYDKEGYWIKRTINDVPVFIPKQDSPIIQIWYPDPDIEWVMEKRLMTKEEFKERFGDFYKSNKE
jgi:hypothetical protein